jgi:hypothetical protein
MAIIYFCSSPFSIGYKSITMNAFIAGKRLDHGPQKQNYYLQCISRIKLFNYKLGVPYF